MRTGIRWQLLLAVFATGPALGQLPVGTLVSDGPATPEQISLYLPVTGPLPLTATAACRYKPTASSTWTICHSLYRIRPSLSESGDETVVDAFAWPIIDLNPGSCYDIEVTVASGGTTDVKTLNNVCTRALPGPSGAATVNVPAGSSAAAIEAAFNGAPAGAVVQLANGSYTACSIDLTSGGTASAPKVLRGESRAGVTIDCANRPLNINASDIIVESMTFQGCAVDGGLAQACPSALVLGTDGIQRVTMRNLSAIGYDGCLGFPNNQQGFQILLYDTTFIGNNAWNQQNLETNLTWNDDCIRVPGAGNAFFNNTLAGFGDTWAVNHHPPEFEGSIYSRDNHFYRNDIRKSLDDAIELDYSSRNNTIYDNRITNASTFFSCDPCYAGPLVAARNLIVNVGRGPFKWNTGGSGMFVFNNTLIKTRGYWAMPNLSSGEAMWLQSDNGPQNAFGFQNNLLVYRGPGTRTLILDNEGYNPVDWSHNSWFPDQTFTFKKRDYSSLAATYAGVSAVTPVFSSFSKPFEQDNITTSNPWTTTVTLPANYQIEVTTMYSPTLGAGAAKNSGIAIPNITDGFDGNAPDRGSAISGRITPQYGDRSGGVRPNAPAGLTAQ